MRIGVVTSLYPGPPRPLEGVFAERRWLGMAGRGHAVRVVQPLPLAPGPLARGRWAEIRRFPAREDRGGVTVERPRYLHLPGRDRFNVRRFAHAGMRALLAGERPDVVVADYAWPAAGVAPLARRAGLPCVVNGRGSDVLEVAGEAGLGSELAELLRTAGHWCAVSQDLVEAMDRLAGVAGRGRLAPNGVDLELFVPRERGEARRELGLAEGSALVLVVGHLIERKDPLLALEAFARGAPDGARLVFLGRGPLRERLLARVREKGLEERVELRGEVDPARLALWYAAADVLLLTSRREGRPNVVLEALASGRPVLATPAGGTGELLGPFAERMLAPDRDPVQLGRGLAALLSAPPDPAVLRAAVEPFSWERGLEALEAVLEEARRGAVEGVRR